MGVLGGTLVPLKKRRGVLGGNLGSPKKIETLFYFSPNATIL